MARKSKGIITKLTDKKGFEWYHVLIIAAIVGFFAYRSGIVAGKDSVETYCDTHQVEMFNFDFTEREIEVHPCDTVIWTNKDSGVTHSIESLDESSDNYLDIDSGELQYKDTFEYTFDEKGTFVYTSMANREIMKAKVTIT